MWKPWNGSAAGLQNCDGQSFCISPVFPHRFYKFCDLKPQNLFISFDFAVNNISSCRHCAAFSFCREVVELAATRLIALHKNKGKSVAACLKSRTDYAQNPNKTQQGELVSSYECSPLTVDEEFMLSKRQYELMTGRRQKSDVIAYQIRQSFKPGEITAEEANKVGYELAMRFTKGKYAFIVATHTDREHIHNHIIYNSTALDSTRKFRDFLLSGLAVQRLSDLICLEHQLSVIEIKPYRERQKRTLYPPRESNRDKLCAVIDNILLNEKPADFEVFLQKLEQQSYEVKREKHTSVKGTRQKRFIRFRTLGTGYSEDEIKAVIAGEAEHRPHQKQPPKEQPFHLLVDIQAKLSEGKGEGYARWAKRYNLKEMSKTLIFLQENKIGSIEEMQERVNAVAARCKALPDVAEQVIIFIKDTDGDLAEKYMSDKIGSRHHFEKIDEFETHLV